MIRRLCVWVLWLTGCLACNAFAVEYEGLSQEVQGQFPIQIPEYDGVASLLPLSNRWLIAVTENLEEIVQEMDRLSNGEYVKVTTQWENSQYTDRPDWIARNRSSELRGKYFSQARQAAGELNLDKVESFTIQSSDDLAYHEPLHPLRTTRWIASLGRRKVSGGPTVHFGHYHYLELPQPLLDGHHYTVTVAGKKKVTFKYDERSLVSRAIKVNQVGYLPSCKQKFAYVSAYLQDFGPMSIPDDTTFQVINVATGKEVLSGPVVLRAANPEFLRRGLRVAPTSTPNVMYGENIYEIDLGALKDEGTFFITVKGVGRSWPFKHSESVYGEIFYTACRGLYHQRCGIPIGPPHSAWPRISCHHDPLYESQNINFIPPMDAPSNYNRFDVIAATIDRSHSTPNPEGGWHDAADWDKNGNHYTCTLDLLGLYELSPNKFTDGQLNIPESGNGIPDILDEAEYGLKVWRKSMNADGGVSGYIDTWTHPSIDDPNVDYCYSRRTAWDSLLYAGAAAQYANLVRPFSPEKADLYEQTAKKAYQWGMDKANWLKKVEFPAIKDRGMGARYTIEWEQNEENLLPYMVFAQLRLFILTGDQKYLESLDLRVKATPAPYKYPFRFQTFSQWLYYAYFHPAVKAAVAEQHVAYWKREYEVIANQQWRLYRGQAYRQTWPMYQDYWLAWGNSCLTNISRCLLLGHELTGEERYREAAILDADFMFGVNPLGMVWTTGLGYSYPVQLQHTVSEEDGIPDPVPGITIYGVNEGIFWDLKNQIWQSPVGDGRMEIFMSTDKWNVPIWHRYFAHPHRNTPQNEFTVHETMSSTIFTAGMLMPEGWMPSEALKNKKPREEDLLFGYYYLP